MARRESGRRRRSEDISDIVPSDGGRTPLADSDVDHELSAGLGCAVGAVRAPSGRPAGRSRAPGGRRGATCERCCEPRGGWCALALLPLRAQPVRAAGLRRGHGLQPLGRPPSPRAAAAVRGRVRRRCRPARPACRRRARPLAAGRHDRADLVAQAGRDHRARLRSRAGAARAHARARDARLERGDRRQRGDAPRAGVDRAARRHPGRAAGRRRAARPPVCAGDPGPAAVRRPPGRRQGRRHADVGLAGHPRRRAARDARRRR